MNYLGIDLGNKRCGLAYSNMGIIFTLPFVSRVCLINEIKKIIPEKDISTIVIGMPYDLYGNNNIQLNRTKKFIEKLKEFFKDVLIVEIDERFTTYEALNILNISKEKNIKDKKDSISAYLILESYLLKIKN